MCFISIRKCFICASFTHASHFTTMHEIFANPRQIYTTPLAKHIMWGKRRGRTYILKVMTHMFSMWNLCTTPNLIVKSFPPFLSRRMLARLILLKNIFTILAIKCLHNAPGHPELRGGVQHNVEDHSPQSTIYHYNLNISQHYPWTTASQGIWDMG